MNRTIRIFEAGKSYYVEFIRDDRSMAFSKRYATLKLRDIYRWISRGLLPNDQ